MLFRVAHAKIYRGTFVILKEYSSRTSLFMAGHIIFMSILKKKWKCPIFFWFGCVI